MIELRFNALRSNGQIVTGGMTAPTYKDGKTQIQQLIEKHKLKLKSIEKKVPLYLETMNPKNVPIYEHYGFKVMEEYHDDKSEMIVWAMKRSYE